MAELMHSRETSPCPTFRRISVDMLLNGLPSSHGLLSSAQKAISTASLDELTLCQPFSPKEDSSPSLCLIDFDRIDEAVPLNTSVSSPLTPHIRSSAPSPASLYIQSNTRMAEVLGGHHSSPVSDLYLGSPKISTLPLPMRILSLHERFVNRLKEQEEIVEGVDGPLRPARNCLDTSHGPDANRGTITSLKPPRMPPRIDNPNEVESTCADRNFAVSGTTREGTLKDSRRVQNKPLPKTHVQGDLTSVLGSHPYHPQRPQAHQFFDSFSPQGSDSRGNKRPLPQERLGGSPHTANLPETIKRTFLRNAFHKSEKYLVIALSHIATLATAAGREKEDDCFPPFKQKRKKPHHYWQAHLREWASLLGRHAIDHINEVLEADGCSQCGLSYSNTKTISIYIWWRICKLVSDIEKVPTPPTNEDLVVEGEFQQGLCLLSELWDGLETALWEDLRNSYRVYCFDPTIQCDPKSKSLPDLLKEGLFQEVPDLRALPDVVAYTRTNPEVHTTQTESTIEAILVRIQNRARNISVSLQLFFKDAPVARSDFEQLVYIFRSTSTDCQASPDISKPLVETERTTRPSFRTWINRVRRELKTSPDIEREIRQIHEELINYPKSCHGLYSRLHRILGGSLKLLERFTFLMPREHHKAWNATTRLASFERHSRRLQKELNKSLEVHSEKETKNEPGEEVSKTQHSATPHRKMLRDEEDEATRKVRYLEFVLSHPKTPENISAKLVDNIKSIRRDIADRDRLYARALQVLEARFWNYGGYMRGVPNEVREKLKRGCQRLVKWENVDVLVEWAIEGWEYEGASAGCAGRADSVEVEIKEEDMEVKIKKEDVA